MNIDFGEFLQTVPSLAEFQPAELAILEHAMIVDEYPDGYEFIGEETKPQGLYLVVEGTVVASHRHHNLRGVEVIERLGPGDLFGLVALIDHHREWATYRAEGSVIAASLPNNAFDMLFTANAPIAHHFQNLIALQLAHDFRACIRTLAADFSESNQNKGRSGAD